MTTTEIERVARPLRDVYGEVITEIGAERPEIVVLDAGVSDSTRSAKFRERFPDRFFNIGIAEANMIDIASGLALAGKVPFASTFAIFGAGRAWEQIRQSIAYNNLNVKIVCTHAGISIGEDGASAQMIEDIALMRVLPNMSVLSPADPLETAQMVRSLAENPGPAYLRLGRNAVTPILPEDYRFEHGKAAVLRQGDDVAIFATGIMVGMALEAASSLEQQKGLHAAVVNVSTIKPLDVTLVAGLLAQTGAAVTAEDHSVIGGLGGAIAEAAAESVPVPLERVGVDDRFGMSGKPEPLLREFGLTAEAIAAAASKAVARKSQR